MEIQVNKVLEHRNGKQNTEVNDKFHLGRAPNPKKSKKEKKKKKKTQIKANKTNYGVFWRKRTIMAGARDTQAFFFLLHLHSFIHLLFLSYSPPPPPISLSPLSVWFRAVFFSFRSLRGWGRGRAVEFSAPPPHPTPYPPFVFCLRPKKSPKKKPLFI